MKTRKAFPCSVALVFFFRRGAPMQCGAHFAIFDVPFGFPCWAQRGRQKIYKINAFLLIFKRLFAKFAFRDPLGGRSRRALHFENVHYHIGFIDVFDALIDSMLDHRTVTKNQKNERHAAWERSGKKRNERRAAWERFSCFHGPVGCLQELPRRSHQTFIFRCRFANFVLRDPLGGRSRRALKLKICNITLVL